MNGLGSWLLASAVALAGCGNGENGDGDADTDTDTDTDSDSETETGTCNGRAPVEGDLDLDLEEIGSFAQPVDLRSPPGDDRLFVVEQVGAIRIVEDDAVLEQPFLDLRGVVNAVGAEQGLLGLAFHPGYGENGRFFVYYVAGVDSGETLLVEYGVSGDRNVADADSARELLRIDQPFVNNNGGNLAFGPDGFLWVGVGDGGAVGDPAGNARNPDTLLGKILRIDVDSGDPYGIPPDNPFADEGGAPEIWAWGLANPWRFTFDDDTGDLWIADVGEDSWEEVDFVVAGSEGGLDFGWNVMEGSHCFPVPGCDQTDLVLPIHEYDHGPAGGDAIVGGYVYRGCRMPGHHGKYFFGDAYRGWVRSLLDPADPDLDQWPRLRLTGIGAFGVDDLGEIYVLDVYDGAVYRIVPAR